MAKHAGSNVHQPENSDRKMTDISYNRIPLAVRERWELVRDIIAGDQVLKEDGCYLPYLNPHDQSDENKARNAAYVKRAVFYGVTARTLDGLLGLAFRKDPRTELPPKLMHLQKNADGAGNSIYQQSQSVLASVLALGRHGLYVDYDETDSQPVIKSYRAEDIINWRASNGMLSLVVLAEEVEQPDGFGLNVIKQYRELALEDGRFICRVHRPFDKGFEIKETVPRSTSKTSFNFLPFQFVGAQNNDFSIDKSPLYDLACLNLAHFRNSADYEDSVFFNGQAQPYIAGLTEEWRDHLEKDGRAYIGSRYAFLLPQGGAFGFAQPQPNTLVREAMGHKERQMVALGARLLDPDAVATTATQNENDRETTTSVLSLCVSNVNEAYQQVIRWCGEYASAPLTDDQALGAYKIGQDFSRRKIDPAVLQAMVAAWQAGVFAKPDLLAYLRSEGVIAVERTDDQIEGDLEAQGPALGDIGGE